MSGIKEKQEYTLKKHQKKLEWATQEKKQSDETIEKRRQKIIGQKRSDETRKKMSEAAKKHWNKIKTFNNN